MKGRLTFELALELFNDSTRPASRIEVALLDDKGKALAKVGTGALPPFTARGVVIPVDARSLVEEIRRAGGNGSVVVVVKSSLGETTTNLPDDAPARSHVAPGQGAPREADPLAVAVSEGDA